MPMCSVLGAAALFGLGAAGMGETRQNKTRASPKPPRAPGRTSGNCLCGGLESKMCTLRADSLLSSHL